MACMKTERRTEVPKALTGLVDYLDGLAGRADLSVLRSLLNEIDVDRLGLSPHCQFCTKNYSRNRIAASPWFELLAVCWAPGQRSQIHDHKESSCAFRVIEGQGTEIEYMPIEPGSNLVRPVDRVEMSTGYVCAAQDEAIHEVANLSADQDLITLHIYSPILSMSCYEIDPTWSDSKASGSDAG